MTIILSKNERTQIVESHLKSLSVNKYNMTLSLIEENAKTSPDQNAIANYTEQSSNIDKQVAALNAEIASIAAEKDTE
jgi:phage terminase large subunit-like protein